MRVRFWGVRGSTPTPATGEDVASRLVEALLHLGKGPDSLDLSDRAAVSKWVSALPPSMVALSGGNTPCIEMTTDTGELFILDFGSGLRPLGNALLEGPFGEGRGHAHLFLTHLHWDHIQGWPFFKPVYVPGNEFDVYARHEHVEDHLRKQQEPPFFPPAAWDEMHAEVRFHTISPDNFTICNGRIKVSSLELDHPSRAYAYRFEADGQIFVYATDGAFPNPQSEAAKPYIDFFRDADLLIFDAQFDLEESLRKYAWGHSSPITGVELACRAGAKRLALFHHDPNATESHLEDLLRMGLEHEKQLKFPCQPGHIDVFLAREGLEVEL